MEYLADARGEVAGLAEELRHSHYVGQNGAERNAVVENTRRIRTQTCQERSAARIADGELAVSPVKSHAHLGQTIDIRSMYDAVAIAADGMVEIIDGDEQYVFAPPLSVKKNSSVFSQRPSSLSFLTTAPTPRSRWWSMAMRMARSAVRLGNFFL